MDVARHELLDLIQKPALAGIPLLVLGNKNDIEGAASVEDLITRLQLKDIQGREVCCYSVSAKNQVSLCSTLQRLPQLSRKFAYFTLAVCSVWSLVDDCNVAQVNIDITLEWLTKHAKSKK